MSIASVGVLLALLGAGEAPVEPTVRWEAPPECGTARELREQVTRQLGALEAGIEITGRVRRTDGLYALELELVVGGERQRRSFSAVDCRTLLDAAAIVSSAALGPNAEPGEASPPEASPPVGVPEPSDGVPEPTSRSAPPAVREAEPSHEHAAGPGPGPTAERTPPPARPPREPLEGTSPVPAVGSAAAPARSARAGRWLLSARAGVGWDGALVAPVGSLGFGRTWSRFRAEALVDAFGGRVHGPRGTLDLRVVTLSPRACATVRPRARVELSPCAGMAAGPAVGSGRDVANPSTAVLPWLAAQLDLGVRVVPRPWLAVGLEVSNYALLGRPRFVLSDGFSVYRAGIVGSRAFLTVELRFSATDRAGAGH